MKPHHFWCQADGIIGPSSKRTLIRVCAVLCLPTSIVAAFLLHGFWKEMINQISFVLYHIDENRKRNRNYMDILRSRWEKWSVYDIDSLWNRCVHPSTKRRNSVEYNRCTVEMNLAYFTHRDARATRDWIFICSYRSATTSSCNSTVNIYFLILSDIFSNQAHYEYIEELKVQTARNVYIRLCSKETLTGRIESINERAWLLCSCGCFRRWPAKQRVPYRIAPKLCKTYKEYNEMFVQYWQRIGLIQ